ncbi:phosphoenolpyruvate--protein phosphotransferase [Actinoplanes sp. KI2]|uniref:phosphoenolpyruvate--protein phosphotransferase n=1 Tax=Actinoplanes sp. KI2 TaxID=2983315 RepID=UPI0021D59321|nr:phosphoenolpyruvate--protein phosphotransferase [Actinoplanes sp. KI2]MCU7726197.1 phosphoenolpyruvate--protein phosphotransferase [Actinoplanes sp. KI2]
MVGLVVVSHSRALAVAAVALAVEMVHDGRPPIEVAAGLDESTTGTDAVAIASAIDRADAGDGVVVLMDLGSAVLSAELALEMAGSPDRVVLCPAPLVEGLVAAVVSAASGAERSEVAAEAAAALEAKLTHLGSGSSTSDAVPSVVDPLPASSPTAVVTVANPHGLHARPAARLVTEARRFDARVEIRNRTTGSGWVPAGSLSRVSTLGVLRGHEVELRASGPQAGAAVEGLVALARRRFDEADLPAAPAVTEVPGTSATGGTRGQAASAGVGVGPAWRPVASPAGISEMPGQGVAVEWPRVEAAVEATRLEISQLIGGFGPDRAGIFEAHLLLLADADLLDDVRARIDGGDAAPRAVRDAAERVAGEFEALPDPYLKGRAADVRAVGEQVVRHLLGLEQTRLDGDGVLIASDLTPGDVAGLDRSRVTGVLLAGGSPTAHAAILARGREIPMVVGAGAGVLGVAAGTTIALDGGTGEFVIAPDDRALAEFRGRGTQRAVRRQRAERLAHEPAVTRNGVPIAVAANVGSVEDARAAAAHGADLAGLVRSEFLFLDRDEAPGVDEQVATYRALAEAIGGRPITVRTLDVGGDKPLRYAPGRPEQNPFLGVRGLRHSLAHPRLFRDQIEAIVQVARDTPMSVMFPMVTSLDELLAARRLLDDLDAPSGLAVGIMVEVPAAALKIATFRSHLDFVSIGTNDLAQYTLAAERGNPAVPADALDPAVLRLIDRVCRDAGVPVAVCGELAADETAVPVLAALGVRELSVTPPAVPLVKEAVRAAGGESAAWALELPDAAAVRRHLAGA